MSKMDGWMDIWMDGPRRISACSTHNEQTWPWSLAKGMKKGLDIQITSQHWHIIMMCVGSCLLTRGWGSSLRQGRRGGTARARRPDCRVLHSKPCVGSRQAGGHGTWQSMRGKGLAGRAAPGVGPQQQLLLTPLICCMKLAAAILWCK
jgi:hypothetical protein